MNLILAWYFPGYKLEDIKDLAHQLNAMLLKKPKAALATVRNKYSHKYVFSFQLIYEEKQYAFRSYFIENDIVNTVILKVFGGGGDFIVLGYGTTFLNAY
jgi:hypothetical protein